MFTQLVRKKEGLTFSQRLRRYYQEEEVGIHIVQVSFSARLCFKAHCYTAISIKVVPEQGGKVEYERDSKQVFRACILLFRFARGQPYT